MRTRRLLICSAAAAALVSSSGCDVATQMLSDENVQAGLVWVGQETAKFIFKEVILASMRPAQADPVAGALPCDPARPGAACEKVAQVAAAKATDSALSDVPGVSEITGKVQFKCDAGEQQGACEERFKKVVKTAAESHARDQVALGRAQRYAAAWPACQEFIANSPEAMTVTAMSELGNSCMTKAGFGEEVAAIKRTYAIIV